MFAFEFQEEVVVSKKKREYRKRKHKTSTSQSSNQNTNAHQPVYSNNDLGLLQSDLYSSDEEAMSPVLSCLKVPCFFVLFQVLVRQKSAG